MTGTLLPEFRQRRPTSGGAASAVNFLHYMPPRRIAGRRRLRAYEGPSDRDRSDPNSTAWGVLLGDGQMDGVDRNFGAGDRDRTDDIDLGKVAFYH